MNLIESPLGIMLPSTAIHYLLFYELILEKTLTLTSLPLSFSRLAFIIFSPSDKPKRDFVIRDTFNLSITDLQILLLLSQINCYEREERLPYGNIRLYLT